MNNTGTPDFSRAQYAQPSVRRPEWQSATGVLIAINVAVFALMVLADRAALMNPSQEQLIKWGADFGPLTLANQFWRVVTSGFLHIGILHIAVNMWSLWIVGRLAEKFVGASSLVAIYLLTGIGASLASLAWNPLRVSAGASGPIFGCVGVIMGIAFFAGSRIDPVQRKSLLSWAGRVAVINLFIGLSSGIDNMAHFGGLLTGAAIGAALMISTKWQTQDRMVVRRNIFVAVFVVLALLFVPLRAAHRDLVHGYRGEIALDRKDYNTAITEFKQMVQQDPNDAAVHAILGYAYREAGRYSDALVEDERSLSLAPDQPSVKIEIGCVYSLQGKAQDAIALFEANIGKVKMDAESYRLFGEAMIQNREGVRAENMLKNALKLNSDDPQTHVDIASAMRMQGRTLEANVEMNTAAELRKKTEVRQQVKP